MRAFADLHCHTSASFDCLSRPEDVVRAAAERGLTHLAITDHDRIDGALAGRKAAPPELRVIVGEEIRTSDGDLIALFIDQVVPSGLTVRQTIARIRDQGGLVGIPHPFDRFRGSLLRESGLLGVVDEVDWIETYNARLVGGGNELAASLARERGIAGVAVSDAHSIMEVAVAYTSLDGDPSSPDGLRAALSSAQLVPGRASLLVRALTPVAKVVQRLRGNGRRAPAR